MRKLSTGAPSVSLSIFTAILQKSMQILTSISPYNILSCRPPAVVCSKDPTSLPPHLENEKAAFHTAGSFSRAIQTHSNCADNSHSARLPTLVLDQERVSNVCYFLLFYIHTVCRVKKHFRQNIHIGNCFLYSLLSLWV